MPDHKKAAPRGRFFVVRIQKSRTSEEAGLTTSESDTGVSRSVQGVQPRTDERLCDEFMSQSYTPDQIHISAAGKKGEGAKKIAKRINHGKLKKYSKFDRSSSRLQKQHAKTLADIMKLKANHGR